MALECLAASNVPLVLVQRGDCKWTLWGDISARAKCHTLLVTFFLNSLMSYTMSMSLGSSLVLLLSLAGTC